MVTSVMPPRAVADERVDEVELVADARAKLAGLSVTASATRLACEDAGDADWLIPTTPVAPFATSVIVALDNRAEIERSAELWAETASASEAPDFSVVAAAENVLLIARICTALIEVEDAGSFVSDLIELYIIGPVLGRNILSCCTRGKRQGE